MRFEWIKVYGEKGLSKDVVWVSAAWKAERKKEKVGFWRCRKGVRLGFRNDEMKSKGVVR